MTTTTDQVVSTDTAEVTVTSEAKPKRKRKPHRDRDFTKVSQLHTDLAEYVNAHSAFVSAGVDRVTPNQVKAILYLRPDFNSTPEQTEKLQQRRLTAEALKKRFEGMPEEEVKKVKAIEKAQEQAERYQQRSREALERAQKLANEATASGEDLAAVVEAAQDSAESPRRVKRR